MANPVNELRNSSYFHLKTSTVRNRLVHSYILKDTADESIASAKNVITQLLANQVLYSPTFAVPINDDTIKSNPYLTVNGRAVCFSHTSRTSKINYADRFSLAMAQEPIRCTQGHILEKQRAEFWSTHNQGKCPEGDHDIGSLEIDEVLHEEIQEYVDSKQENRDKNMLQLLKLNRAVDVNESNKLRSEGDRNRNLATRQIEITQTLAVQSVECVGKIAFKIGAPVVAKKVAELAARKVAEAALKETGKKMSEEALKKLTGTLTQKYLKVIPVLSLGIGILTCGYRCYKGDYVRGCLELVSGGLATLPGLGIAFALALDMGIIAYDVYWAYDETQQTKNQLDQPIEINYERSYAALGLDATQPISKEAFDKKFNKIIRQVHPDKNPQSISPEMTRITQKALKHREEIYKKNNWGDPA